MLCQPLNRNLQRQVTKALETAFKSKEESPFEFFMSYDFDQVKYMIVAEKQKVVFSFKCHDFETIWKFIEQYFVKTYYPQFSVKVPGPDQMSMSMTIDSESLEKINAQGAELIKSIAQRFGTFKRNFMASIFEIYMQAVKNKQKIGNLTFALHPKERTWIVYNCNESSQEETQNSMSIIFGLSFADKFEQAIVKMLLIEMSEATRHVQNPPAVSFTDSQIPHGLIEAFPRQKDSKFEFTSGITMFTLYARNLTNLKRQANMLAGFRSYIHYHCHASKCNLHSRILNRIEKLYKAIVLSKFEEQTIEYTSK